VKIEVVSKDVNAWENDVKVQVVFLKNLHIQKQNCGESMHGLEDHVRVEALSSNLPPKFRPTKKILPTSFPSHLLKNI